MAKRSKTKLKSVPRGHPPLHTAPERAAHSVVNPKRWFEARILWWIVLAALLTATAKTPCIFNGSSWQGFLSFRAQ